MTSDMDNIILFEISVDCDTLLWDIHSVDPEYSQYDEVQIGGGNQFFVMQDITHALASECGKVAAFKIGNDEPPIPVIRVETADVPVYAD